MGRAPRILLAAAALTLLVPGFASAKGAPSISFVPGPTFGFGQVALGSAATQAFVLTNSGGVATAALTISLTGSSAFTITANTCSATSLGPKKSCSVTVQYSPGSDTEIGTTETGTLSASSRKPAASAGVALSATVGQAANQPPLAADDTFLTDEGVASGWSLGNVLLNDSDADNDAIALSGCVNASGDITNVADQATGVPGIIAQLVGCELSVGTNNGAFNLTIGQGGAATVSVDTGAFTGLAAGDWVDLTIDYSIVDEYGGSDVGRLTVRIYGLSPA